MIKQSSGEKIASGIIYSGQCLYYGFVCVTGGSNRTVGIYDNVEASGKLVEKFTADANKPTDGHSHANPVECNNGLYLDMSGGNIIVFYAPADFQSTKARLTI